MSVSTAATPQAIAPEPVEAGAMALAADYIGLTRDEWPWPNPAWLSLHEDVREAYRRKARLVLNAAKRRIASE